MTRSRIDEHGPSAARDSMSPPSPDVVSQILAANAGREPERLALKYAAMRRDAFAFMRGSADLFYQRLAECLLPVATPSAWICGDLHLENFGSYKGDDGLVYFDINDFDNAALAPLSWDIVRLLASILVAGDSIGLGHPIARTLCDDTLCSYAAEICTGHPRVMDRNAARGPIAVLLDDLHHRSRLVWLNSKTELVHDKRRIRLDGSHALPVTPAQRAFATGLMNELAVDSGESTFYRVLDVARRVAGTGSLGLERYVILVEGKGSPDHNRLLDLKEAVASPVGAQFASAQPQWVNEAQRVVTVQRRL